MLRKIKAIAGLAVLAALGGAVASISGADYVASFGPAMGALVSAAVGYVVKEDYPLLVAYLSKVFGVNP